MIDGVSSTRGEHRAGEDAGGAGIRPVRVSRATSTYNVHAYHTKVPVEAITPFVRRYSRPGETVLDPFCGSGMTGVAAALEGRNAILNDLSPAAVHIARNYTAPCSSSDLDAAARRLAAWAEPKVAPLNWVECPWCSRLAVTEYVVWSDVRVCPSCRSEMVVWEYRSEGSLRDLKCHSCGTVTPKTKAPLIGERPVSVNIRCPQCRRRDAIDPRPADLALAQVPTDFGFWYPDLPFGSDWDMWRGGHRDLAITRVADFWSHRNLMALSVLWEGISREPNERVREALRFVFTGILNRASRRYQWNSKRPTNVLGGTLYVSSIRYEFNVLSLWGRKLKAVREFYRTVQLPAGAVTVVQGSATALSAIPTGSVDYCFTDPPFGANIYYADASLLWESWLGSLTDRSAEAVVSTKRPDKSVADYQNLMARSLWEVRRCLKPDGIVTMVFQNTDQAVWQALKDAARDARLNILWASTLHKAQPSFKGVKGATNGERVAASDVVMTMSAHGNDTQPVTSRDDAAAAVRDALQAELDSGTSRRTAAAGHMYAVAMSALISQGFDTTGWTFDRVRKMLDGSLPANEQLALGISDL